jgi:nucleoid DNA-binding protein
MTRKEIVSIVAERLKLKHAQAKVAVDLVLASIGEILCEHGRIELRNFGVFEVKTRAARKARNPRTNTPLLVPSRRVVTFQPGKLLAEAIAKKPPIAAT